MKKELDALISGGHAEDTRQAKELRKQILAEGGDVTKWIESRSTVASYGDESLSGADEQSDFTALMNAEGISLGHAKLLRKQIITSGGTVREFLLDHVVTKTADIYRRAGDLVKLAGSKERAIEAIQATE